MHAARVGGQRENGALCGAGTVNLNNPLSNANSNNTAALSNLMASFFKGFLAHRNPHPLVKIKP